MKEQEIWDCEDCGGYSYSSKGDVYHYPDCLWYDDPEAWVNTH